MLGRTGVAHYGRRCSWAHSEGHIGVAHYGILVGGPLQLRWQPIGRRCLWAHLGEVPTMSQLFNFFYFSFSTLFFFNQVCKFFDYFLIFSIFVSQFYFCFSILMSQLYF